VNTASVGVGHSPHLVLVTANPVRLGGMQTFTRFLTRILCSDGWRVTVALSGENIYQDIGLGGELNVEQVDWVDNALTGDRRYCWETIVERLDWFRRIRPDVALFVQSSNTPFRASAVGARLARIPIVFTQRTMPWIRDFVPPTRHLFGLLPGLGLHNHRQILKTGIAALLANRIVYNSRVVREAYENDYAYPRRRGCVIVNAATVPSMLVAPPPVSETTIGYLGRLGKEKRIDVLIEAVAAMANRRQVRLLIVGDGPERERLAALVDARGLTQQTSFHGPTNDVATAYARMGVVAMCSRRESSSNAILEAMALGKAVVVSDAGGLPELIDNGRAGVCVPIGDVAALAAALDRLTTDARERRLLGERARRLVRERHDPGVVGPQWLALLREVAGQGLETQAAERRPEYAETVAFSG
jgi:glycosyltransferase involved in cell wall biosynthesis